MRAKTSCLAWGLHLREAIAAFVRQGCAGGNSRLGTRSTGGWSDLARLWHSPGEAGSCLGAGETPPAKTTAGTLSTKVKRPQRRAPGPSWWWSVGSRGPTRQGYRRAIAGASWATPIPRGHFLRTKGATSCRRRDIPRFGGRSARTKSSLLVFDGDRIKQGTQDREHSEDRY